MSLASRDLVRGYCAECDGAVLVTDPAVILGTDTRMVRVMIHPECTPDSKCLCCDKPHALNSELCDQCEYTACRPDLDWRACGYA